MSISANLKNGIGGVITVFTLVAMIWGAQAVFATDDEVSAVKETILVEVHQVSVMHELDKVSDGEARKNDRIDRVDRDIRKLDRLIDLGDPEEKAYNERERADLILLRQNIMAGHR